MLLIQKKDEKPYIAFCPRFFNYWSLQKAVDHYKDSDKPDIKWNVDNYQNRGRSRLCSCYRDWELSVCQLIGLIFLHELFHLDLAANSEKNTPNPKIFDIKVSYESETGVIGLPKKAYGARLSKLLARFQPKDPKEGKPPPRQTGYWVQRNVDNFSRFAMAKYLEAKGQLGAYPYFPFVYDKLQYPLEPGDRQGKTLIGFEAADGSDAILDLDTSDMEEDLVGEASFDETHTTDEVFEVGEPYSLDDYPESYREAYAGWLKELEGNTDGICKLEVHQIWTCEDVASNLYAELKITDPSGNTLYQTGKSAHTPGVPINDAFPLKLKEDGMDETLTVVGEHTDDYIQFYYGSTAWRSTDTEGDASCKLVGDNWAVSGPGGDCPNAMAVVSCFLLDVHDRNLLTTPEQQSRNFECQYPCGSSGV